MEIFKWRHRYSQISGLHAVVVCLLLGAVVLVVGLVQLAPGATTTDHRLALLVAGSILLLLGEPFFPLLILWNYTKKMLNSCQNDSFLLDEWERRMDQENIPFFVSVWFRIKSKKRNKSLRGYREQCNSII